MNNWNEDLFDESKIKHAINKGKRKSIFNIISISVIVFILLNVLNIAAYFYSSERSFKQLDAYTRLTTPNGYLMESSDSLGFLGGTRQYKIAKDMGHKSIVIEQNQHTFGYIPSLNTSRSSGSKIGVTGESWQISYKENGWKNLLFFHPNVSYKKYYNDQNNLQDMDDHSLYEIAFSFDKPYKINHLPLFDLPEMTWFWVNSYSDEEVEDFQYEANQQDWTGTFIDEKDAVGFTVQNPIDLTSTIEYDYEEFLSLLQTSNKPSHNKAYKHLKDTNANEIEVLGVVLYGTKKDLQQMFDNPIVKAASIGGVIDNY